MRTNLHPIRLDRYELESIALQLTVSELVLPFWGYRKAMPVHRIVWLEGEGNYTHFYFDDGTSLLVSLTLKRLESRLPASLFARTHKKNLINLLYLR